MSSYLKIAELLILFLLVALNSSAVQAVPEPIVITQPDGSERVVFLHGDEKFHYITDSQGKWLKKDERGYFIETQQLSEKQIEQQRLRSKFQIKREIGNLNIVPHGIVILVNFKDKAFRTENSLVEMYEMYNGSNYTYRGATGSCKQYFKDQSMGAYIPQFDVVGPVTLSNKMSYYGAQSGTDNDIRPAEMVAEACRLANSQFDVDFTKYDSNNDGEVDFVFIIFAGNNEAETANENQIWPHSWRLEYGGVNLILDSKRINLYACTSELRGVGVERAGIGTFCHEFSHVLGLPDMYDTGQSKDNHKTLGSYDIMDNGNYNNNGNTPCDYSAYERWFMGWLTPQYLSKPQSVSLYDITKSNSAYIITESLEPNYNVYDPNPNTFYLVENRQQIGWDKYIPGHGMMLTKIHYNYYSWVNNNVNNNKSDMGIDIIEAGGSIPKNNLGASTDLFPAGATEYTKIPNNSITDIKEQQGIISFDFKGGEGAKEVFFNYAQAVYLSDYYDVVDSVNLWELDIIQYNENYELEASMSFIFDGNSPTSICGQYDISDMYFADYELVNAEDTTIINLKTGSLNISRLYNVNGELIYHIIADAYDDEGKVYYILYDTDLDCWNLKDYSDIEMTDTFFFGAEGLCVSDGNERLVFFEKSEGFGDDIRCYIWHNDGFGKVTEVCGEWPGERAVPLGDGIYRFEIPNDGYEFDSSWMIIFNDGINQTADLEFKNQHLYTYLSYANRVVMRPITKMCNGDNTNIEVHNEEYDVVLPVYSPSGQLIRTIMSSQYHIISDILPNGLYLVGKEKVLVP